MLEHLHGEMLGTRLPREIWDAPPLGMFKIRINRAVSNLTQGKVILPVVGR